MKRLNKLLFLIITVALFTRCSETHFNNDAKIKLTATNYVDGAMVEKVYYEREISKVDMVLDSLQEILDSGQADQTTQKNFDNATEEKQELNTKLNGVRDIASFDIEPTDWPPPPDVCQLYNICLPNSIRYFLINNINNIKKVTFLSAIGEDIGNSDGELSPLPDFKDQIMFQKFNLDNFEGDIIIRMETLDGEVLDVSGSIYN